MADNLSQEHENKIQTFSEIANISPDEARRLLEVYNGDLQAAVNGVCSMEEDEPRLAAPTANILDDDDDDDYVPEPTEMENSSERPKRESKPPSRFGTISSLKDNGNSSESEDNEGQAYYAGGSERGTGQQVLGPPKKNNKDLIKNIFKSARDHGAVEVNESEPSGSSRSGAFHGTGYRLGQSENEQSEVVRGRRLRKSMKVVLKMYKNGFIVGDEEELRPFTNPENARFLREISSGRIPQELINKAEGGEVLLDMEDYKEEEYVPKKKKVKAFTGHGQVLGAESSSTDPCTPEIGSSVDAINKPNIDPTKPTTNIQIRLANGSRMIAKLNTSHTIKDLQNLVRSERPEYATTNFVLMTTFPNKVFTEEETTIEEAGLLGSAMTQKLQ